MTADSSTPASASAMVEGRRADSARRRQRVLNTLTDAANDGEEISVSGIASRASVDRTFLYRHRDLLEQVHAAEAQPRNAAGIGPRSQSSLATSRPARRTTPLHHHGRTNPAARDTPVRTARRTGLVPVRAGRPDDIEQLKHRTIVLEQQVVDLRLQLEERDQELLAARAANRELITQLNASRHTE